MQTIGYRFKNEITKNQENQEEKRDFKIKNLINSWYWVQVLKIFWLIKHWLNTPTRYCCYPLFTLNIIVFVTLCMIYIENSFIIIINSIIIFYFHRIFCILNNYITEQEMDISDNIKMMIWINIRVCLPFTFMVFALGCVVSKC